MIESNYINENPLKGDRVVIIKSLTLEKLGRTAIVQEDFNQCGEILIEGFEKNIVIGRKRLYKIFL